MENSNTRRETTHLENQENNLLSTNPKEDSHTNIKIISIITGSNYHYSLITQHQWTPFPNKKTLTNRLDMLNRTFFCCIKETHLSDKDRHYLKVKGWKKIPSKWPQETSWNSHSNIK